MTPRQKHIYEFVEQTLAECGMAPSFAEIGRHVGIASKGIIHRHIHRIVDEGYLRLLPGRARSLAISKPTPSGAPKPISGVQFFRVAYERLPRGAFNEWPPLVLLNKWGDDAN